jgi:Fe-S-cluster containining protein
MAASASQAADAVVCARCALQGPTCCHTEPGREEFCFPLSDTEQARMREFLPDAGGFVLEDNSAAFVDGVCRLFPGEDALVRELFPLRKQHMRLAVDGHGACRLLGSRGCQLPREARPYYCRLFPFWVAGGEITLFDAPGCLVRRESKTIAAALALLGMTRAQVLDLHGRLRLLWGLPPRSGMAAVKRGF